MINIWNYISRLWKTKSCIDTSVETKHWTAAGVLFTNNTYVLGGVQQCNDKHIVSGIGGSRQDGETYIYTALREMIEEIFDIIEVPKKIITVLEKRFKPTHVFQTQTYITVVYTFKQLEQMLRIVKKQGLESRLYESIPCKLHELMLYRFPCNDCELSRLLLVNLYPARTYSSAIHKDFIQDLVQYKTIRDRQTRCLTPCSTGSAAAVQTTEKGLMAVVPNK
jgi:hypothetical protein